MGVVGQSLLYHLPHALPMHEYFKIKSIFLSESQPEVIAIVKVNVQIVLSSYLTSALRKSDYIIMRKYGTLIKVLFGKPFSKG